MIAKITQLKEEKPLLLLFLIALVFRLLAAVFAKGFLMFDDHFLLVDIPYAWLQDYDFDRWLPNTLETKPAGFSLLYPAFQYGFFKAMTSLGVHDPQLLMFFNRLVLALFSTLTLVFSYKIALHFSNKKTAFQVGLLLSVLALMPYLSVRNLVEVIGIPFVMWGIWWQLKNVDNKKANRYVFWGAFILGIAFSVRFQNALFLAGIGLYYLIVKDWLKAFYFAFGGGLSMVLFQLPDWFIFGEFFAEFKAYFAYNDAHKHDFIQGNVFKYLLVLLVACGLPLSFGYLFAFFRYAKKYLILFLPAFLFLAFHSLFPNKQERFILPALPLILT
ncbi:MAG: glycosyltransferase family 39 protein, partial [Flavobacteriales bacterium]